MSLIESVVLKATFQELSGALRARYLNMPVIIALEEIREVQDGLEALQDLLEDDFPDSGEDELDPTEDGEEEDFHG